MKPVYKSRTVWFGILVALAGMLEQINELDLPPWAMSVVGFLIVALRLITRQRVV